MRIKIFICVLVGLGLGVPASVSAQGVGAGVESSTDVAQSADEALEEEEEEEEASKKDWNVSGTIRLGVGQGTFVDPANDTEFADEVGPGSNAFDLASLSFLLGGSYTFLDDFSASISLAAVQFLTDGGGLFTSGRTGGANAPREFRFQDIGLGVGWSGYSFGDTGLRVASEIGTSIPTSAYSRTLTQLFDLSAGASLSYTIFDGALAFTYGLSGAKFFHEVETPTVDDEEVGAENVLNRAGDSASLGDGITSIGGVNVEWALSNSLGANLKLWYDLSFSLQYGLTTFWTYAQDNDDEFTAEDADPGRGVAQLTTTAMTLSYPLKPVSEALSLESFSLALGTYTAISPKTADNESFNFPFWNFSGAASNRSQIRFSVSAVY